MAIAPALHHQAALVVTAAGQAAGGHHNAPQGLPRLPGVANTYRPGRCPGSRPAYRYIPAQIHQRPANTGAQQQLGGAVAGVLLHATAEIHLHTPPGQAYGLRVPLHPLPANQRQQLVYGSLRRQPAGAEIPGAPQHPRGEVEQALALLPEGIGKAQQAGRFLVYGDRFGTGGSVDATGQGFREVAAVLGLEAAHLALRRGNGAPGQVIVVTLQAQATGAAHGPEAVVIQGHWGPVLPEEVIQAHGPAPVIHQRGGFIAAVQSPALVGGVALTHGGNGPVAQLLAQPQATGHGAE